MAIQTYEVGTTSNPIKVQVEVGIDAIAHTTIYIIKGSDWNHVVDSLDDANGDVPLTPISTAVDLVGKTLYVQITLNFENIDPPNREAALENMVLYYTLTGGPNGARAFSKVDNTSVEDGFEMVYLDKRIKLI
ncbi:hypothetical protein [Luteirhabdus pelagi]|uniref:hypothetical protein n=1 Tax=Luteirhabdus pelagi TaxID=2792783 RepID=UPI001939D722|nr:hypothetical protein [Luteirhabdus pelagi]